MTREYHPAGDFTINEEQIKVGKERAMAVYKVDESFRTVAPSRFLCARVFSPLSIVVTCND